jgi:hypothetical protein
LSFASIFTGGTSISAILILTSLIMIAMIARVSLNRGDVSWKLAGRVIAGVIVLVIVGVLVLYANNCGPKCLNPGFTVPFVGLGAFGAVLCCVFGWVNFSQRIRPISSWRLTPRLPSTSC